MSIPKNALGLLEAGTTFPQRVFARSIIMVLSLLSFSCIVGGVSLAEFQGGGKYLIEGWSDV
jgi:hypothetical protein